MEGLYGIIRKTERKHNVMVIKSSFAYVLTSFITLMFIALLNVYISTKCLHVKRKKEKNTFPKERFQ